MLLFRLIVANEYLTNIKWYFIQSVSERYVLRSNGLIHSHPAAAAETEATAYQFQNQQQLDAEVAPNPIK